MNISFRTDANKYIWCLLSFTVFFVFDVFGTKDTYKTEKIQKSENEKIIEKNPDLPKFQKSDDIADNKPNDQDPDKNNQKGDGIVGFIEKISKTKASDLKKPFSDQPGYIKEVQGFDRTIYNMDTKKEFKINDLKGNVVIIFFTTTWCPNCPAVFKDLDSLADKLSKSEIFNVKIIPLIIGDETENYIRNYYKVNNIQSLDAFYPISPSDVEKNVSGVPSCIVFNKNGESVWGFVGIANYASQEFLNFIEALAKEE